MIFFFVVTMSASRGTETSNSKTESFFANLMFENGRCWASYGWRVIEVSAAAIFA